MLPRLSFEVRLTIVGAYLLIGSEWVFQITKSSFLSSVSPLRNVEIALNAGLTAASVLLLAQLFAWGTKQALRTGEEFRISAVIPALVFTALAVLLVDNFTYTLFRIGIVHTRGIIRFTYLGLIAVLTLVLMRRISAEGRRSSASGTPVLFAVLALCLIGLVATILFGPGIEPDIDVSTEVRSRPNIIFFASDGVDADSMSLYGAERKTTPVLDAMKSEALIALHAAPSSLMTTSSTTSMLTGISPMTTHVFYPPQLYTGRYARYSFPTLLRRIGYLTYQRSVDYYGDAEMLNMRGAFDWVNGRPVTDSAFDKLPAFLRSSLELEYLFLREIWSRVRDRALHLIGLRAMVDVYAAVAAETAGTGPGDFDERHIEEAIGFIRTADRPFFMHLHLMDTHCCSYSSVGKQFFTPDGGRAAEQRDLYDTQVLRSDQFFGRVVDALRARGLLNNTVLVYSSDHGSHWDAEKRVPLIFFFPKGEHAGTIAQSAQLLDVVPTLLDYLGLKIPHELEGSSLLDPGRLSPVRPLYRASKLTTDRSGPDGLFELAFGAPNWGLRVLGMTVCQRQFNLDLQSGSITQRDQPQYSEPCREGVPTPEQAKVQIADYLTTRGFRVGD